jgi:hypothetical protein
MNGSVVLMGKRDENTHKLKAGLKNIGGPVSIGIIKLKVNGKAVR